MEQKELGIRKKYSHEIGRIEDTLRQFENGRVYEISGAKMDGYLATQASKLLEQFRELLRMIDAQEDSFNDSIHDFYRKGKDHL